nr:TPA: NADH dehydrogenase subunit 5 [Triannulata magna]
MKTTIYKVSPMILMLSSVFPMLMSLKCYFSNSMVVLQWEFMQNKVFNIPMLLIFDTKGMIFSSVVLFISSNVLMFSKLYMLNDKFINRFTMLVLLFILSMNMLVVTPHLIMLLLGWDGLGIVSFILVVYYQNSKSLAAGMVTALSNRVGDVMILLSIAISLNSGQWFMLLSWEHIPITNMEIIFIMVAAMTKSAQIPFSSWLPAAMAAPTPVSALVHSSTLVTAGVFLLIRFYNFLHSFYLFNTLLMSISMLTMIMAGICAMMEMDMKKIIALSTLSQLGLMMLSLSLNMPDITFMHLIIHALFKALLFISAGTLINMHTHSQDMRWMGNLTMQMPMTSSSMILASITMSGMPFLSAFYSKDLILEMSMNTPNKTMIMLMLYVSLIITSMYSMRLLYSIIFITMNSAPYYNLSDKFTLNPIMNLSYSTIMSGVMFSWLNSSLYMNPMPIMWMLVPMMMMLMGMFLALTWIKMMNTMKSNMSIFLSYMWFITPLSTQFIMPTPLKLSKMMLEFMDYTWLENLSGAFTPKLSNFSYNKYLNILSYNPMNMIWSSIIMSTSLLIAL